MPRRRRRSTSAYCTGRLMAWWRDIGAHARREVGRTERNETERNRREENRTERNGMERNETERNETTGTQCRVSYVTLACVASITRDLTTKCFSARTHSYIVFAFASLILNPLNSPLQPWLILLHVAITLCRARLDEFIVPRQSLVNLVTTGGKEVYTLAQKCQGTFNF